MPPSHPSLYGGRVIVFDGDSVMKGERPITTREQTWPYLLAGMFKSKMVNLAGEQGTAADCRKRLSMVLEKAPESYFLQVGQWSQNHEPQQDFKRSLQELIEPLVTLRIPVVVVSPPHQFERIGDFWEYFDILRTMAELYRGVEFVDVTGVNELRDFERSMGVICHFSPLGADKVARLIYENCR